MRIGYARQSDDCPSLDQQRTALEEAGCSVVVEDIESGQKADELLLALGSRLSNGDELFVTRLEHLGVRAGGIVVFLDDQRLRGVSVRVLDMPWLEGTTPLGGLIAQTFTALAKLERNAAPYSPEQDVQGVNTTDASGEASIKRRRPRLSRSDPAGTSATVRSMGSRHRGRIDVKAAKGAFGHTDLEGLIPNAAVGPAPALSLAPLVQPPDQPRAAWRYPGPKPQAAFMVAFNRWKSGLPLNCIVLGHPDMYYYLTASKAFAALENKLIKAGALDQSSKNYSSPRGISHKNRQALDGTYAKYVTLKQSMRLALRSIEGRHPKAALRIARIEPGSLQEIAAMLTSLSPKRTSGRE